MRIPKFLPENGTIGFVAPSFGVAIDPYKSAFLNALDVFHGRGYKTEIGPNVFRGDGIGISATPGECARELEESYLGASDVILSVGGGELMCEDLSHLHFDRLKDAPAKWYMGYSDNTNFTFLLPTLLDTAAIYGPCASNFGMKPWHESVEDAFSLLTGLKTVFHAYDLWEKEKLKSEESPLEPYNVTEESHPRFENWDGAPISGRFIGGCLDCLVNLCGTRFDRAKDFAEHYREDGIIWFLESCDLNVFAIRRALWQLKEAGWFRYVKAFLIGRPLVMGQSFLGLDQYDAVTGILREYDVPILMDLDIGHLPPMMPIVSGGYGTVEKTGPERIAIRFDLK